MHPRDFDVGLDEPAIVRLAERVGAGETVTFESLHRRKDGTVFPVEVRARQFRQGDQRFRFSLVRDITERRRAEQRVLAQHLVTRILAEAPAVDDATPKILQALCECLGWDLGALWRIDREAGVLRCTELWRAPSSELEPFEAATRATTFRPGSGLPGRVWASRAPACIPDVAHHPDYLRASVAARSRLHAAFAFPILLGGEVLGVMDFVSRDVRQPDQELLDMMATIGSQIGQFIERKRAEDALQLAQAELAHVTRVTTLGELAASIAHEVRNPLGAIVASANASLNWLAAERPDLEQVRDALNAIVTDGHRAADVIQRIRQLATKSTPHKVRLDIEDVIGDVVRLVRAEVLKQQVALRLELDSPLAPVLGDRVQLQQVILNLVMNGIDAMTGVEHGRRELTITSRAPDAEHIVVAVADTGVGIDPSTADQLFDAFFTTKPAGMGMGLSISRSIIESHGGRLWAAPNTPCGAVFAFSLLSARLP
jgi:signal transduction histidine kinase